MDAAILIAGVLFIIACILTTIALCKYFYAKKAGVIMRRMCFCSEYEREMFKQALSQNSNSFGTNIFELFDVQ